MRCRKARWYLSARCDGTLSERQRLGLEAHLASCEECRREGFFFSEIGSMAKRVETHGTSPDFNLRLRASIRRAEAAALQPNPWYSRWGAFMLRPAMVSASVVVLGLGGLGAWSVMDEKDAPKIFSGDNRQDVNPKYGLSVRNDQAVAATGQLIPLTGFDEEARRLQERYLQAGQLPRDYVIDAVRLDEIDRNGARTTTEYVMPTVTPDQVTGKVSY